MEFHYLTELLIGSGTSGILRKFKAERKTIISPQMQSATRKKIIVLCYLNSGMGSINIPTEESTQIIFDVSQVLAIILSAST